MSWFPVSVNRRHPPPSFQSLHKREVSLIELSTVVGHKNRDFYFPEAIIREQITSTHLMPSHHSSTKGSSFTFGTLYSPYTSIHPSSRPQFPNEWLVYAPVYNHSTAAILQALYLPSEIYYRQFNSPE